MDTATAEKIEAQLLAVVDKLKAGISHEQIIQAGAADWQYSERVMRWFVFLATVRIIRTANHRRQKNAMVAALATVQARKRGLRHG